MESFLALLCSHYTFRYVITAKDSKGYNLLHWAVKGNDPYLVRVLIRAHARAIGEENCYVEV